MLRMTLWAEFTEVLRIPLADDDFVRTIPWRHAGFRHDLPLVDVGAGSGHGTVALAEEFGAAEIVAVEPDPSMRCLLMQRIAERPDLRDRVTVLPDDIVTAPLPAALGGAALLSVIYLLDPDQRRRLWDLLAERLVAGAPVLMNRSYGAGPREPVAPKLVSSATMGRQRYERWFESAPMSAGGVEVRNTFRVFHDGELAREETATTTAHGLDEADVLADVPADCFIVTELDDRYLLIHRR
jgi:hypothetical protein